MKTTTTTPASETTTPAAAKGRNRKVAPPRMTELTGLVLDKADPAPANETAAHQAEDCTDRDCAKHHVDLAAEVAPDPAPTPAAAPTTTAKPVLTEDEKLAKLRAQAEKRKKQAERAEARLAAAEKGEPLPSFGGGGKKGELPAVHHLNRVASRARCMQRSLEWFGELPDVDGKLTAMAFAQQQRDAAIAEWTVGVEKRKAAGEGDAKALHALGLAQTGGGPAGFGGWELMKLGE